MDPNSQNDNIISTPSGSRKRERENETPSQRHKRVMAAERQRRKRERDRNNNQTASTVKTNGTNSTPVYSAPAQQHQLPPPPPPPPEANEDDLSPEEKARRERVRAAARERQRKHRALVKDRKMRELGLDMGNEITDVQYRDGQYLMAHELDQQQHEEIVPQEPPFPQGQPLGGQTFASTLLLSFSCAPLLKQHLLRNLQMTNEELASLEPIIADAWDHWDHQAAEAMKGGTGPISGPSSTYATADHMPNGSASISYNGEHTHDAADFRTRFQRSLVAPSPFRAVTSDTQATTPSSTTASNASGPPSDGIDSHLSGDLSDLGQARGEAEGVVGRLERR
ncbi:hypothetical protein HWV62_40260 [Athelia sp. TMB]|nr:hypothetical protein HWV62_40260 [Athelia sp. TMB]